MTGATTPAGAAGLDGAPVAAPGSPDGAAHTSPVAVAAPPGVPARAIAEAVRTATGGPAEEGARRLLELALAGGPWSSAALARPRPSGGWETWTASGPLAQVCDRIQWDIGEGPAHEALSGSAVTVSGVVGDLRWPAWQAMVGALGVRSVAAVALHAGRPLGVMTAYGADAAGPGRAAVDLLGTMAAHLSVLLDVADRRLHLERAMVNRGVIGQAIGMLVERYGITVDQAFGTLRRVSQHENVKISRLATVLTQTGDLPGLHRRGG